MKPSLHQRIRNDIEAQIWSGTLMPGDRIPVEHELMKTYGCARMTVNKAISGLAADGVVERRKRSGTIVARPRVHSAIIDVPDLPTEVRARGQCYHYKILRRLVRMPASDSADEQALGGRGELLEIESLHFADDVPLALEHRLVSLESVPAIVDAVLDDQPPGTWLLQNVPWTNAETRVCAVGAQGHTASLLQAPRGTPCLMIERRTWRVSEQITTVRQTFLGSAYDLLASFDQKAVHARVKGHT